MFPKKDKKNRSLKISAPNDTTLYDVRVRKLPIAKYIRLLHTAEELPQMLIGKAFPGQNVGAIMQYLKNLNKDNLIDLITRLLAVVPEELMKLLSELLDIPRERLLEDSSDALSPKELLEIISAFWELNDMSDFFGIARRLAGQVKAASSGSNAGSPSLRASVSRSQN